MSFETAAANDEALKVLGLEPGDRVLEVGFGHGRTIERAAALVPGGFVAGIDTSEEMLQMATRRCRPLPTHLYELRRVLRAEGRLVLGFRPTHDAAAADFPASIYSFYETEKVLQLFEHAGFEDVRAASTAGGLTLATGSRRAG